MKWLLLVLFFYGCAHIRAREGGFKIKNPILPDYIVEPLHYNSIPGDEETIADYTYLNVKNIKRVLILEGNYTFTKDMDNSYVRIIKIYHSSKGNDKYEKFPVPFPEAALCDCYNTSYKKFIEPHFKGKTNFPTLPPEGLCPIPKGFYWAKNVTVKEEIMPLHIPRGTWRLQDLFYRTKPKRSMVGGAELFVKVIDK